MDVLRSVSSRGRIRPTSFTNDYSWGSFKGDPVDWMERYFDAFLYYANWGSRTLMLRLPKEVIAAETLELYCSSEYVWSRATRKHLIVGFEIEAEEDVDVGDEPQLAMRRMVFCERRDGRDSGQSAANYTPTREAVDMDRRRVIKSGIAIATGIAAAPLTASTDDCSKDLAALKHDKEFFANWLADLLSTAGEELDRATRVKLIEGCGRGCYRRHEFKQKIAAAAAGDVDKLIAAYSANFDCWRDDAGDVHVRYGETSKRCYCPVAGSQPPAKDDMLCECTKATHATIFREALGHAVPVDIIETLRRGGRTCHFVARVSRMA